jgi:hypothetical protein
LSHAIEKEVFNGFEQKIHAKYGRLYSLTFPGKKSRVAGIWFILPCGYGAAPYQEIKALTRCKTHTQMVLPAKVDTQAS